MVFGMEGVPIFEMLFILMVLMLGGLVFILLEIRKLVALVAEEQVDIQRFEGDLAQFERAEGKKPPNDLVDYVKNARYKGVSEQQIQKSLNTVGWNHKEISGIMQKVNNI